MVRRYEAKPDGTLANGRLFFDMTKAPSEDAPDGIKVDVGGNLYVSGPCGLWVIAPAGIRPEVKAGGRAAAVPAPRAVAPEKSALQN